MCNSELRSVGEIPPPYCNIFNEYPCFNAVQSQVLDDVLYTDDSVVVSAPTGSGKTVIFELALVRLLIQYDNADISQQFKVVYICPIKSLCQERLIDWHKKFSNFGINCVSVTGDSDNVEFQHLINHNLIISTPEKWDSLTRRWKDNEKIVKIVKLFMIDEVHLLNEENRGSTLEVIVSRMKTVENSVTPVMNDAGICNQKIRFIALSATVPNVEDIAEWIGKPPNIKHYRFSEEMRPVKLKKIILGYNCNSKTPPFKFDLSLNYKLQSLMMQYSEGKPTLIFCSTRKSVEMTANHIVHSLQIHLTREQRNKLMEAASLITDVKARETLKYGVGYHHAGLIPETRHLIENLFRKGDLPILVTTSTLAMGVNLPAHLVIVKSTKCYDNCGFRDYTETAIHQMIGRAGRPQFDTSATALILTTNDDKHKFEQMVGCGQPIESNLHRHLTEHLNAEVVLRTITDLDVAMQWLASTFLYVRARKNPRHYGLNVGLSKDQIDKKLLEMCQIDLNKLVTGGMITMDQNILIAPTTTGQIMAKYYVAFETMKLFTQISGTEILIQILALISKCHEFSEMRLRVNDKKTLNLFNKNSKRATIRFPLNGRIKTRDMKVNCIIQAVLGNLDILDHSLLSESFTIMRNGARIAKCLIEYLGTRRTNCYNALLNTIILAKCFHAKLWENSPYVCKQLSGIGTVMSNQLVNAGKTTFQKILESNPRDIEMHIKRKPPMGNQLIDEVRHIPHYNMTLEKIDNQLKLTISLVNRADLEEQSTVNVKSAMVLLIGNNLNEIMAYERYQHSYMMENTELVKFIGINKDHLEEVNAHFISENWVGIDCNASLTFESIHKDTIEGAAADKENNKNKKAPTYIQLFLDMYMKTKKKSTEVVQRKQKIKMDDTSQTGKEVTNEPKKLDEKTCIKTNTSINKDEISKLTNTNSSKETEKSVENSAATEYRDIGASGSVQFQNVNENVADKDTRAYLGLDDLEDAMLDEIFSCSDSSGSNKQLQYQKIREDELEHHDNIILDERSNASSISLYSNNSTTTMDPSKVSRVHGAVEAMEIDQITEENDRGNESRRCSDDHRLVIDEGPIPQSEVALDLEEKVNMDSSLFHLTRKYKKPVHCRSRTWDISGSSETLHKRPSRKRPALMGFKFPNKKMLRHQSDLENMSDSMDNILQPSNTNTNNRASSHSSYMKDSSQGDENKENVQRGITWRSPLVSSPAIKFSPKMSSPGCFTSRDEADTSNEPQNETFETTSSTSTSNLTLNIQRTAKNNKNTSRNRKKKRFTKFPLCDKDYSPNNEPKLEDDASKLCSSEFMERLGLNRGTPRGKKADTSPAADYYSQLMAQPVQSQKQNTENVSQRGAPDRKNEENVDAEVNNMRENMPQNTSTDSECAENYLQPQNLEVARRHATTLQDVTNRASEKYTMQSPNLEMARRHATTLQDVTNRASEKYTMQSPNLEMARRHATTLQDVTNRASEKYTMQSPNLEMARWHATTLQDVTNRASEKYTIPLQNLAVGRENATTRQDVTNKAPEKYWLEAQNLKAARMNAPPLPEPTADEEEQERLFAEKHYSLQTYHNILTIAREAMVQCVRNSDDFLDYLEYKKGLKLMEKGPQQEAKARSIGNLIVLKRTQNLQNTQAGFLPPPGFAGSSSNPLRQHAETFVPHNYPDQSAVHVQFPVMQEELGDISVRPSQIHNRQTMPQSMPTNISPATTFSDNFQRGRPADNNLHNRQVSAFMDYGPMQSSQPPSVTVERTDRDKLVRSSHNQSASSFMDYGPMRDSEPPSVTVEKTDRDKLGRSSENNLLNQSVSAFVDYGPMRGSRPPSVTVERTDRDKLGRSSQNDLHSQSVSLFTDYGLMRGSQPPSVTAERTDRNKSGRSSHNQSVSPFEDYGPMRGSRPPSVTVEKTDRDKFVVHDTNNGASGSTNNPTSSDREHFQQVLQRLWNPGLLIHPQEFTPDGTIPDDLLLGFSQDRTSQSNVQMPSNIPHHPRAVRGRSDSKASTLDRPWPFNQPSSNIITETGFIVQPYPDLQYHHALAQQDMYDNRFVQVPPYLPHLANPHNVPRMPNYDEETIQRLSRSFGRGRGEE